MQQLAFQFNDEAEDQKRKVCGFAPTPAEAAILRQFDAEQDAARCSTPEDRQRVWRMLAEEERAAARKSRRGDL